MTFPRTPGDTVCDAFRAAVKEHALSKVEVGAALATLIAGWLTVFVTDEQIDSVMEMLTETVKVSLGAQETPRHNAEGTRIKEGVAVHMKDRPKKPVPNSARRIPPPADYARPIQRTSYTWIAPP